MTTTLAALSAADEAGFIAALGGIYESAPRFARSAWRARPFASADELHAALVRATRTAPEETKLALVMALPELAGNEAEVGALTGEALIEHASAGVGRLPPDELARLRELNHRYRDRCGFPFAVTLRGRRKHEIVAQLGARPASDSQVEFERCLTELESITRLRLEALLAPS